MDWTEGESKVQMTSAMSLSTWVKSVLKIERTWITVHFKERIYLL